MDDNLKIVKNIFLVILIIAIGIYSIDFFGGRFKDSVTKNICALRGEEYLDGEKLGDGSCIIPAGIFK